MTQRGAAAPPSGASPRSSEGRRRRASAVSRRLSRRAETCRDLVATRGLGRDQIGVILLWADLAAGPHGLPIAGFEVAAILAWICAPKGSD